MKRLLLIAAGSVAVALSASFYVFCEKPTSTLSSEELHLKRVIPYSGLPLEVGDPAPANVQFKGGAAYDLKTCAPKAQSFGRTPARIHFREGENPTGLTPIVAFQILESGDVTNIVLKRSSGIRDEDNAALDWVKGSKYNNRPGCGTDETEVGVTIDFAAQ